jgi:putative exporter of polyketide antibiotics
MTVMIVAGGLAPIAVPAADRGRGSLDLLLATPLDRGRMICTTFVFTLASAPVVGAAPLAGAWLGAATQGMAGDLPARAFLLAGLSAAALVVCFGCLALLVSVLAVDRGRATIWFIALTSGFVMLDIGSTVLRAEDWIEWLHWLTPTGYYRPRDLALGKGDAGRDIAVLLGLGTTFAVLAWCLQIRRRSA